MYNSLEGATKSCGACRSPHKEGLGQLDCGGDKVLNYKQICKYDESVVLEDQSYTVGTRGVLGQCNCNGQIETNMGPD